MRRDELNNAKYIQKIRDMHRDWLFNF
jgi:hypothetical protein